VFSKHRRSCPTWLIAKLLPPGGTREIAHSSWLMLETLLWHYPFVWQPTRMPKRTRTKATSRMPRRHSSATARSTTRARS